MSRDRDRRSPKASSRPRAPTSRSRSLRARSRSRSPRKDRQPPKRERSPTPRPTKIFVGRLSRNVTKDHVLEIFGTFGNIKSVYMGPEPPHMFRGSVYVEYAKVDEAETAMKYMDGGQVDGQEITAAPVLDIRSRPPPAMMVRRSPPKMMRRRSRWSPPRVRSPSPPFTRGMSPPPGRCAPPLSPPRGRRYHTASSSSR